MASEIRVNKIENRSGLGTVTFADTGVDLAGIVTATTFSGSGASLTALPAGNLTGTVADARISTLTASKLSGALPALDGSALTGVASTENIRTNTNATFLQNVNVSGSTTTGTAVVGGGVTISESGIEASGIGITCANINGTQIGGRRNVIRNGAMQVIQRGSPLSVNANEARGRTCTDGWEVSSDANGTAVFSTSKSTDTPDGFGSSLKLDVTTADTSIASDVGTRLLQRFEGQDLQGFKKGSSDALQFTLSFYVKSPKTGTHCIELLDIDNTRSVSASYTISSANTWQYVSHTFPADTTGALDNDNGQSFIVLWWLAAGSNYSSGTLNTTWGTRVEANRAVGQVNITDSTDNNFYITGCQLEIGSQATPFEHHSFAEELILCQRYFQIFAAPNGEYTRFGLAAASTSSSVRIPIHHIVEMRSKASWSYTGGNGDFQMPGSSNGFNISQVLVESNTGSTRSTVLQNGYVSVTAYQVFQFSANGQSNDAALLFSAEL